MTEIHIAGAADSRQSATRNAAIVIPASPTAGFYSQIAAFSLALSRIKWHRWRLRVYAYFGAAFADYDDADWRKWEPFLREVTIVRVPEADFLAKGNSAQVDATLELAPRNAEVIISMDADTLPVGNFEQALDRVFGENLVAGVIAHYPPPPGTAARADWAAAAEGLITKPLAFRHRYTLVPDDDTEERRFAPFYVNGGVVFYSRRNFDIFVPAYLAMRARLETKMSCPDFSGQVAFTLAVTELGLPAWELPIRYNFPNDAIAAHLHPHEAQNVVIFHYLRTGSFDRQKIFVDADAYGKFLGLNLLGPDLAFQDTVRGLLGARYPFS